MKKVLVCLSLLLAGCASESTMSINDSSTNVIVPLQAENLQTASLQQEVAGFQVEYKNHTIIINQPANEILNNLGEPMSYFEADSCAFLGKDRTYMYGGLEVATYELEGIEHILSINFMDDIIPTSEGIYLFDESTKVIEVYGQPVQQTANMARYVKGDSQLDFIFKDDVVVSMFMSTTLGNQ